MRKITKRVLSIVLALIMVFGIIPVSVFAADSGSNAANDTMLNPTQPNQAYLDSLTDPYGKGTGRAFMLNEETELFSLNNYYKELDEEDMNRFGTKVLDTLKPVESDDKILDEEFESSTSYNNLPELLSFTSAVSFDPMGTGRRGCVAVVGINGTGEVRLYVCNTRATDKSKAWSEGTTLGLMREMCDIDTIYYQVKNFLTMTAGDYNGDGRDTLIVYAQFDRVPAHDDEFFPDYELMEVSVNVSDNGNIYINPYSSVNVNTRALLNPEYVDSGILEECDDDLETGEAYLDVALATGDVNSDGIDDLCVVSYNHGSLGDDADFVDHNCFVPYLAVSLGYSGIKNSRAWGVYNSPDYSYYCSFGTAEYDDDYYLENTIRSAGITVANVDDDPGDEIIVAGEWVQHKIKVKDKHFYEYIKTEDEDNRKLAAFKFSYNGTSFSAPVVAQQRNNANPKTGENQSEPLKMTSVDWQGIRDRSDETFPKISVEAVHLNGKGSPASVVIGGQIYDFSSSMPCLIYSNKYISDLKHSKYDLKFISDWHRRIYIDSVAIGNFDGNPYGFEQVVLTIGAKTKEDGDWFRFYRIVIGAKDEARDPVTHLLPRVTSNTKLSEWQSKFYSSGDPFGYSEMGKSTNDDYKYGMTSLIAAVDSDDDGTLGRYKDCKCVYADPEVLAVLQASPYYSEMVKKKYVLPGNTSISYSNQISDSKSSSKSSSLGFSHGKGAKVEFLGIEFFNFKMTNSYAMNWSEGFTESISYNFTRSFSAGEKDQVIVYRTPIYMYTYEIYNPELNMWGYTEDKNGNPVNNNTFTFNVAQNPHVEQMTIEDYNKFANEFNEEYLRPECKNPETYASPENYGGDLVRDTDGRMFNKKMFDANKLTELDSAKSCVGVEGSPTKYKGGNGYYSLKNMTQGPGSDDENKFSMNAGGSSGQSGSISYSYTKSSTTGTSKSFSLGLSGGLLGKHEIGIQSNDASSETTAFMQGSSVSISTSVNNNSGSFEPNNSADYEFGWKCMLWDSNIPCEKIGISDKNNKGLKDAEFVPVIGYTVRYGDAGDKSRVLLHPNGGDCPYVVSYFNASGLTLPVPKRDKWSFSGWYDNADFNGNSITAIGANESGNKEFWAKWDRDFNVTLHKNGGDCEDLTSYSYGKGAILPIPTREGYVFMGWYNNSECIGTPIEAIGAKEEGNKEFWALWSVQYSVTLNKNGGTCQDLTSYYSGFGATLPVPTRGKYIFEGWYDNPDFTGTPITEIGKNETGNKKFWAKWTSVYSVSLHYNGSEADKTIDYKQGQGMTLPVPKWDNKHAFAGWYDNPDFKGESVTIISKTDTGNKEYWAKWVDFVHEHNGIKFNTSWDSNTLPTKAGKYCLTCDIKVTEQTTITEDVSICLNGHKLTVNAPIRIVRGGKLSIYDCSDAVTEGYIDSNEHVWKPGSGSGESCNLKGAIITSDRTDMRNLFSVETGELNLYGGNIAGVRCDPNDNEYYRGGLICSYEYADCKPKIGIYGGNIIGNRVSASENGHYGIIFAPYAFEMTDGKISRNYSETEFGGTVCAWSPDNFKMTGGEISDNISIGTDCGGIYIVQGYPHFGGDAKVVNNLGSKKHSKNVPCNLYMCLDSFSSYYIYMERGDNKPRDGMKIGVSHTKTASYDYFPITSLSQDQWQDDYEPYFTSDDSNYEIVKGYNYESGSNLFMVKKSAYEYKVTLHKNGGTCPDITGYYSRMRITLPVPTRDGYEFDGWYDNPDFNGDRYTTVGGNESSGDKEFWAKWIAKGFSVTLHTNGGTCDNLTYYARGVGATLPVPARDGYTFAGWYDNPYFNGDSITAIGANETGDKEFWANWTANTYKIYLHKYDGRVYTTDSYTCGVGKKLPVPTRDGFTFAGWYDNRDFEGNSITAIGPNETGDKEFWAKWTVNTYSVTLHKNGGACSDLTSYTQGVGATLPVPTKDNCTFAGWYDNPDFNGDSITAIGANESGNKEFWAKWTVDAYNVTLHTNGGTCEPLTSYKPGSETTLPTPTRDGCTFAGWYDNADFNGDSITAIGANETGDKEFWAKWTANTYKITFHRYDRHTLTDSYTYGVGKELFIPNRPLNDFAGWYDNPEFSGDSITAIGPNETGDKEFWAKWNPTGYSVYLNKNGGTCDNLTYYARGVGATLPVPTRNGYTFAGWYNNPNFNGDSITEIGPNETGDKDFWAKWIANTYNVTLHKNGGVCDDLTSYTYGVGATLPVPTKDGFTFAGWYDNADFNGNSITAIGANETGAKEFWAKWTVNTYNVTLHANGGVCDDLTSYTYGVGATLPVPTKDGFTFAGWYDNADFNGNSITAIGANETGNKEFWAKWNIVTDDGAPEIIVVGNDIVLLQHKYPVDKLSLAYIGPVYKEINDWNSFETAGLLYKDINGSIGYKQYPHPADGKTIAENNTGYYAAFIRYYVDGVRVLKYQVVYLDADEHLVHFDADNDHFCDLCGTQISSHKGVLQNGVEPTLFSAGCKSYYLCSCDTCFEDEECLISIRDLAQWKSAGGRGYLPMLSAPDNISTNGSGNNLNEQVTETPEQAVEQVTEQTPVTTTEPTTEPTTEKEAEQTSAGVGTLRSKGTVWIIVGVVAAAILGVVLYIIIRKKKKA